MADDKTRMLTADELAKLMQPADDGDKTRVLSGEEAARLVAGLAEAAASVPRPAPRFVGDRIKFYCSNGHLLDVERGLAGKRGTCSKKGCGAPVLVPSPPNAEPAPGAVPPAAAPRAAPGEFAFDLDAAPSTEAAGPAAAPEWSFPGGPPAVADEPPPDFGLGTAPAVEAWGGFDADEIDHPTARLVARLWQEKSHGGIVEVHLSGGSVIMPEWYDPRWSCGTHALFAAEAPDKRSLTLTAVAWDQVQKVVVRQVQGIPDGMFQG